MIKDIENIIVRHLLQNTKNRQCLPISQSNKKSLTDFYFIDLEGRPNPECYSGKCICSYGYEYDSTNKICEPLSQPGWDHSIKGGSHHQGKFILRIILKIVLQSIDILLFNNFCVKYILSGYIKFSVYFSKQSL